jgi:hypothetical protein
MDKRFRELFKDKRRIVEAGATLAMIIAIVAVYGSDAPQLIIILSFWSAVLIALFALPFAVGLTRGTQFRMFTVIGIVLMPLPMAFCYWFLYGESILRNWFDGAFGGHAAGYLLEAIIVLPILSYVCGLLFRRMRRE